MAKTPSNPQTEAGIFPTFPRTCHVMAYYGVPAHFVPQEDPFHEDGYDSFVLDAGQTRIIDPASTKTSPHALRIRVAWPEDKDAEPDIRAAYEADRTATVDDETAFEYIDAFTKAHEAKLAAQRAAIAKELNA